MKSAADPAEDALPAAQGKERAMADARKGGVLSLVDSEPKACLGPLAWPWLGPAPGLGLDPCLRPCLDLASTPA